MVKHSSSRLGKVIVNSWFSPTKRLNISQRYESLYLSVSLTTSLIVGLALYPVQAPTSPLVSKVNFWGTFFAQ